MLISLASCSINEPGQVRVSQVMLRMLLLGGHFLPKHEPGEAEGVAGDAEDAAG